MTLKKIMLFGASSLMLMSLSAPQDVAATPAFARQTSQSCAACHFQRFPLLNAYGRTFKANGYTQVGKQGTIEDSDLSLPTTLNAAIVSKFRYQKTNGTLSGGTNTGEFQVPDEASLFFAGRVAKNIGFQADITIAKEGAGLGGFKVPIVFPGKDVSFSAIPFFTDAQGAAYGYELLNTGAVEYSRVLEHSRETSAQQYLVKDVNEAAGTTGVALVARHKYGYLSFTPHYAKGGTAAPHSFLSYVRGVVTPAKVGNFDLAGGFQLWKGTSQIDAATTHADVWAVDAQAQGKVGKYPLGVYVAYGSAAKSGAKVNEFNTSSVANKTAFTVVADLGIIPSKLGLEAAYRNARNGSGVNDGENAFTLGAIYNVSRNVALQVNHSMYSYDVADMVNKGDRKTTVMLFSAF
jgi:hypothetical protein